MLILYEVVSMLKVTWPEPEFISFEEQFIGEKTEQAELSRMSRHNMGNREVCLSG